MTKSSASLLQEIQDFRRQGASLIEWWELILSSPQHRNTWENHSPRGKMDCEMWSILLSPRRKSWLIKHSELFLQKEISTVGWEYFVGKMPLQVRKSCLSLLNKYLDCPTIISFMPLFFDLLQDRHWEIRKRTAILLGKIGKPSLEAVPALIECLEDEDNDVSLSASQALVKIGKDSKETISILVKSLKSPKKGVRAEAARVLGEIGQTAFLAIPPLMETLQDSEEEVRYSAILSLSLFKEEAKPAIKVLIKLLQEDPEECMRADAAWALRSIGKSSDIILALIYALKDSSGNVKWEASESLRIIAEEQPSKVVQSLIQFVEKHPDLESHSFLILLSIFGDLGPKAKEAVPFLLKYIQNTTREIRIEAIWALGQIGSHSQEAIPLLLKFLKEEKSAAIRRAAAETLGRIQSQGKEIVPLLCKGLEDSSSEVRKATAIALGNFGKQARVCLPELEKCLKDPTFEVKQAAENALKEIREKNSLPPSSLKAQVT